MKPLSTTLAAVAAISFIGAPLSAQADPKDDIKSTLRSLFGKKSDNDRDRGRDHDRDRHDDRRDSRYDDRHDDRRRGHSHDRDRTVYLSRPSSTFVLSFGDGYRGKGYYYGPANSTYFYERQGVTYYRTREAAPRRYYSSQQEAPSRTEASVQRALAQRGYYRGPIDGDLGRGSRAAISRYQADRGMRVTGDVNTDLLRSLGL